MEELQAKICSSFTRLQISLLWDAYDFNIVLITVILNRLYHVSNLLHRSCDVCEINLIDILFSLLWVKFSQVIIFIAEELQTFSLLILFFNMAHVTCIPSSSDWFIVLFMSFVIGQMFCFGFALLCSLAG